MNDELRLIQHLYGEAEAPETLEDDAALRAEYEQMRRVRNALDARPAVRPSTGVLDRVIEGASVSADPSGDEDASLGRKAGESRVASPRRDRSAVPPRSQRWTRLLSVGGALAVVLLLMIVGQDQIVQEPAKQEQAVVARDDAEARQESTAPRHAAPAAAEQSAEPAVAARAGGAADENMSAGDDWAAEAVSAPSGGEVPDELLAWDASQAEVFEAYRRVQVLQARSRSEGLRPTGTRRALYD